MLLDGDELMRGDRIYHLTGGWGVVETIEKNIARIRMDSGGVMNMRENGFMGTRKLFFWFAPLWIIPRKGKQGVQQYALSLTQNILQMIEEKHG